MTRSRNKHRQNNYQTNLCFLKKYNTENGTSLSASLLSDMAHRFSSWEEKYVPCHENGYEDFRGNAVRLDYNEILEMLFKGRKANGEKAEDEDIAKAEAAVVEMLNGMKHMSEDIEKKEEDAA